MSVVIMEWILRVVTPPVDRNTSNHSKERNNVHDDVSYDASYHMTLTSTVSDMNRAAERRTHMSSSTKRMFLFSPSMAVISSSVREKSNICEEVQGRLRSTER